ncbi:ATP12 family chaperone protein [Chelativorans intermedius]|uniref:ATP12 family chaperone protein n=1 Tax=Chelativorans intermedius TaxID=515947 RepID=A0ABV6D3P6_9HYPH|nr:ATP12 family protein [Chelativorans intermedius]MCT8996979.1 ATPase [Chelativorans intermedius]
MRDILNDLENDLRLSDPDPVRRAQKQMRKPLPRRFYKNVSVAGEGESYSVLLDGRAVRTPAGNTLALPNAQAAQLVAQEYDAQGEEIDPMTMPVTRLVNTAIDGVASDTQAVAEDILRFASSDLLCYRAEGPERLVEQQAQAWDPVLDWVEAELGARFVLAEGVMHVEQPRQTIAAVAAYLRPRRAPLRLAALHVMTTLTGSALLALAVEAGAIEAEEAWRAAHVDEDWNIAQWGEDAEAAARRAARRRDMMGAVALLKAMDEANGERGTRE